MRRSFFVIAVNNLHKRALFRYEDFGEAWNADAGKRAGNRKEMFLDILCESYYA